MNRWEPLQKIHPSINIILRSKIILHSRNTEKESDLFSESLSLISLFKKKNKFKKTLFKLSEGTNPEIITNTLNMTS